MTGLFLCSCLKASCGRREMEKAAGAAPVFEGNLLCTPKGIGSMAAAIRKTKLDRALVVGCNAAQTDAVAGALRKEAGLTPGSVLSLRLRSRGTAENHAAAVQAALASLAMVPDVKTRKVKPSPEVLVIGGGTAGMAAAEALGRLGRRAVVVERTALRTASETAAAAASEAASVSAFETATAEVLPGTTVAALSGHAGRYTARLRGAGGETERTFGAIIVASGLMRPAASRKPFVPGRVLPLSGLKAHLSGLARREFPAAIAVVLDMAVEETKAGSEAAFRACLEAKAIRPVETYVFLHDARVAALGLEDLYDKARDAGVQFVKYEGRIRLDAVEDGGVRVRAKDTVLGEDVEIVCGLAAVSEYGLPTPADPALAAMLGLDTDALGRLQNDNIRLLPELSNRAGIFVAGACRGATYGPDAVRDARNAALSAHALLSHAIEVELSHAVVDGDKCAVCLTCVRLCPFRAMMVNAEKKQAECVPESCRRCGICAGECPNKAITLPLWTDGIVLARAGAPVEASVAGPLRASGGKAVGGKAVSKAASRSAGAGRARPAKGKEKRP